MKEHVEDVAMRLLDLVEQDHLVRAPAHGLCEGAPFFVADPAAGAGRPPGVRERAIRLSESMADLEYAIKSHEVVKDAFGRWLACHIVIAIVLYALLAVHVWSAWYFGIRWLP